MSQTRFQVVVFLLVLILLVASVVFGLLTYWVDGSAGRKTAPDQEGMRPGEHLHSQNTQLAPPGAKGLNDGSRRGAPGLDPRAGWSLAQTGSGLEDGV